MKVVLILLTVVVFTACKKEEKIPDCYDASLVHNGPCPANCPGVKGCDGKKYCNECEAARQGIKVK